MFGRLVTQQRDSRVARRDGEEPHPQLVPGKCLKKLESLVVADTVIQ